MNLEAQLENLLLYGNKTAKLQSLCYQSPTPFCLDMLSCEYHTRLLDGTGRKLIIEFQIVNPSGFFMKQNCGNELPVKKLIKKLRKTDNIADFKVCMVRNTY